MSHVLQEYQHFYSQFTFEYRAKTFNSLATVPTLAGTCPDIDFLECAKSGEVIRDLAFLAWLLSAYFALFAILNDFIQNLHCANLGSPYFTTHSLYLSCTSHSSRNLQSPCARGISNRWKSKENENEETNKDRCHRKKV